MISPKHLSQFIEKLQNEFTFKKKYLCIYRYEFITEVCCTIFYILFLISHTGPNQAIQRY